MNYQVQSTRQQWALFIGQAPLCLDFPLSGKPSVCHSGLPAIRCYGEGMQIEKVELNTEEVNFDKKLDSENTN